MTPVDDLTEEEALAIAMLLGFEWSEPDHFWLPCRWHPCHDECDTNSMSCWGVYYPCNREKAVWRFLLAQGVISKIPDPKKP